MSFQSSPQREPMSPEGYARRIGFRGRTRCPCCGGAIGIRAAFRLRPHVRYERPLWIMTGRKRRTFRDR